MYLAPRTELYQSDSGYVLRTADDEHFALSLDSAEIDELLGALTEDVVPTSARPRAVLTALVGAGHVLGDDPGGTVSAFVSGHGRVAAALVALLGRIGTSVVARGDATHRIAISDDGLGTIELDASISCFRDGNLSFVVPAGVRVSDVHARRAASSRHRRRIEDGYTPTPEGRKLMSSRHPVSDRAAEFLAAHVMAEIFCPQAIPHHVTAIDLRSLSVTRHPVLPVPEPPQ